ncbi:transcription termination factor Rho [Verrucomicrobiaceae bacterium R5-34]|uniref:Transcription termination factor Rho n=1 Tax=Oceaniferula flava TaxID=2800421 RepID=A0AAE2SC11_9BACT|nr:transcription termination factor Rho [Oceaniferula flavus]MBK1829491.1 transcription termination factor Rho [Verrucomicrobiaceae bacterium R5-34]MBK1853720.1 transcription termination factor Rho [Oceaniferula flavus]MBM1135026.1 transcription termination factor Rho [Oceaniferula flavus]
MSDPSTQDPQPESTKPTVEKAPAKKKSAKKAAKKTAKKATKAVKKTAKKAAKKTAKKAAKKAPKKSVATQEELPLDASAAKVTKADQGAKAPQPAAESNTTSDTKERQPEQNAPAEATEQPKMGRVKGLGPVKRDSKNTSTQDEAPAERSNNDNRQNDQDNRQQQGNRQKNGRQRNNDRRNNRRNKGRRDNDQNNNGNEGNGRGNQRNQGNQKRERPPKREIVLTGDPVEVNGMLEIAPKGFGFLRVPEKNFEQCKKDVFVPPDFIRTHGLRAGVWIHGTSQEGPRGPQLTKIETVNDLGPDEAFKLPHFEELKAINPDRRIAFETTPDRYTTRVLDIVAPVGRGQRGLIVSPPRSGKTTLMLHMAEAIREKYDESIHLIILLVDERPEEVTEFRRCLPGVEIYASSNDDPARNHARISEMCIERAKRLVEGDKDVLILMDSITRLARAYNTGGGGGGGRGKKGRGYQSGGIVAGALELPRKLFAAARNTRQAGSLTILATALIQTNSRADEAIFQEFKGTGNMELVLDRRIAEQYIYPAVDIFKSGTRREELIMAEHLLNKIHLIRRGLAGHRPEEAMERLLFFLKRFPNNAQMLMEIKG